MIFAADIAAFASGGGVGFLLGLLGGGGSVLAVPLLLYVVGVPNAHLAIGTSALGVGVNAVTALAGHARRGTIKWPCAITFALAGAAGAALGANLGRLVDPKPLTLAFAGAMVVIALSMLRPAASGGDPDIHLTWRIAPRLIGLGLLVGIAAGFFGIGGGFLIVPGLMAGSGMPMLNAVGSSLVSVAVFGLTTAATYAMHGDVLWGVAAWMIAGGALGAYLGMLAGRRLAARRAILQRLFAAFVIVVAAFMVWKTLSA
jgi:uncharacterized membrane protein YfcA